MKLRERNKPAIVDKPSPSSDDEAIDENANQIREKTKSKRKKAAPKLKCNFSRNF
jgi:hypothetical protein